jgi:serine/threonine protein kinase
MSLKRKRSDEEMTVTKRVCIRTAVPNIYDVLGDGSYGTVFGVMGNKELAIKRNKPYVTNVVSPDIIREIAALQSLKGCNNIVQLLCILEDQDNPNVPMILLKRYQTTLLGAKRIPFFITLKFIKTAFRQILNGLQSMENLDFYHRDLKPNNILVNLETSEVVIADFGLSRKGSTDNVRDIFSKESRYSKIYNSMYTNECGSRSYAAPELLMSSINTLNNNKCSYNSSVDIWSLGIIIVELFSSSLPFISENKFKRVEIIEEHVTNFNNNFKNKYPIFTDIIVRMLKTNYRERITVTEALNHEYFSCKSLVKHKSPLERVRDASSLIVTDTTKMLWGDRNKKIWKILVEWLIEVKDDLKYTYKTLFLAVRILVRVSRIKAYSGKNIHLFGVSSLAIAAMVNEKEDNMDIFKVYTEDTYTVDTINGCVSNILNVLEYKVHDPTEHEYLVAISKELLKDGINLDTVNEIYEKSEKMLLELILDMDTRDLSPEDLAFKVIKESLPFEFKPVLDKWL